jgi:hypothetical protein
MNRFNHIWQSISVECKEEQARSHFVPHPVVRRNPAFNEPSKGKKHSEAIMYSQNESFKATRPGKLIELSALKFS